jgi:hypothetical protein
MSSASGRIVEPSASTWKTSGQSLSQALQTMHPGSIQTLRMVRGVDTCEIPSTLKGRRPSVQRLNVGWTSLRPRAHYTSMGNPRRGNRDASRRYHDRVARQYDSIYDDPYWEFHDELTWRLIKPFLPRDAAARCADLGCGTGKWGLRLLKSG